MAELTITSPCVNSTPTHLPMGSPMPESTLTLSQSRLYTQIKDFGFSLRVACFLKYGKPAGTASTVLRSNFASLLKAFNKPLRAIAREMRGYDIWHQHLCM
jgi:hypothetical protein